MEIDALVAPLRADVVSGASVIGRTAADVVRRAVHRSAAQDTDQLREMLANLCIRILEAQPAMAPLVTMTSNVLEAADPDLELAESRTRVLDALSSFKEGLDLSARRVADRAGALLSRNASVLTLSFSSTVASALTRFGPERHVHVICLEARPISEGQRLARELARAGLEVTFAVDAAAGTLAREADLVFLGADSLGDRGVVNKVGSLPLALAAREAGVPIYVLLGGTKLLPPGFPQTIADDRPEDEVWKGRQGIRIWNRYFEVIPLDLITEIVTEEGSLDPTEIQNLRSRIPVPSELRAWASARSS
ncbi:MAG: translation initiation factor eIF-2B [Gemmatimonadota bacterium]